MTARRAFPAALFMAALAVAPAGAQEPSSVPESQDVVPVKAVERSRRERRESDGEAVPVRAPRVRDEHGGQEVRPRVRPAAEAPPPAPAAFDEDQQGGRRRPGGGGGSSRGGGQSAGGDSGARPRGGVRNPGSGAGRGGYDGNRDGVDPRAQAVPRGRAPRPPHVVYAPSYGRRYYAGAAGLGYYFYDPWSWYAGYGAPGYGWGGYYGSYGSYGSGLGYGGYDGGYGSYGAYGGPYGWSIGGVRLKVNEKDAEVYVDGYYAGIIDDFDGLWQQLRLDDGGYHIEIRKPGMSTLTLDVRVQPGRTTTYRGQMTTAP